ncbi:tapasin [Tupaia chinensis]|uniref:tapasin n=1 Tax=Tupaia chinensis TaxID=246437 RepID=UPI000FFC22FF|nr:tapasin [Tupaia chinensis]
MKPLPVLLAVALGERPPRLLARGQGRSGARRSRPPVAGSLAKRPAALLLRQGPGGPPPRPDLDPKFYLNVHDPTGALQAAFRRYPRDAPAPHCEMSRYVPLPASANWASGLYPGPPRPRGTPTFAVQNQPFEPARPHPALRRPAEEGLGTPSVLEWFGCVRSVLRSHWPQRLCLERASELYPLTALFSPVPLCSLSHTVPPSPGAERVCREGWKLVTTREGGVGKWEFRPPLPLALHLSLLVFPVVLTVLTHTPVARIRLGQDAMLDLSFAYMPPTSEAAASLGSGPPPFGLEWRRQHWGKGHLLLAATPGLSRQMPAAREGAVAFAAWDDDEPWGPWTGNGTFWLPAVRPFQEGTYLATVHLPYLQGQVAVELAVYKPPKVSLKPAPVVWAVPGEAPPELLCLVSHFYPSQGLEVEWEVRGGPDGSSRKAEGQSWLSALRHHSDGSVSLSGHLQLPRVTTDQHGERYICRVHHPNLRASMRSSEVTLEVAGLAGPSLEDGIGLFLSAFLLLGLIKALGWVVACVSIDKDSKEEQAFTSTCQHTSISPSHMWVVATMLTAVSEGIREMVSPLPPYCCGLDPPPKSSNSSPFFQKAQTNASCAPSGPGFLYLVHLSPQPPGQVSLGSPEIAAVLT